MKPTIIFSTLVLLTLLSCGARNNENSKPAVQETPKALKDNNEIVSYSRGNEDLVESLYAELVDKDPNLKALESNIEDLNAEKTDSLKPFQIFNQKNESYYSVAKSKLTDITDTILRKKIAEMVMRSFDVYNGKIAVHKQLVKILEARDINLKDLHNVLKIVKTMHVMEQYQNTDIPSKKIIEHTIHHFDTAIQKTDSIIKN